MMFPPKKTVRQRYVLEYVCTRVCMYVRYVLVIMLVVITNTVSTRQRKMRAFLFAYVGGCVGTAHNFRYLLGMYGTHTHTHITHITHTHTHTHTLYVYTHTHTGEGGRVSQVPSHMGDECQFWI
ncbi:hypothetical protein K504DRAFT_17465 [Pleomassaria siparia CBS 279.74]|uniref:Uncharacterized protein n=1 Tax=Pleomassaria siparia CBS 279.74 TaxID=1314801 RepID=A0A6G1KQB2_9PLEO|nr:hypothetical protein K504DRAFT_17465 [Pleomassaria siparia CBS 279.74]